MFGSNDPAIRRQISLEGTASIYSFLVWAQAELRFTKESVEKYRATLVLIERQLDGRSVETFTKDDLLRLKARFVERRFADTYLASTLLILRRYLSYLRDELSKGELDPSEIHPPKRRRREVNYLSVDEVERLVASIKLRNSDGSPSVSGLRFRALVEMLLGSALRITELLSINRGQIDLAKREAKIVGKGGYERTAFFTARALRALDQYLAERVDSHEALFVKVDGSGRLKRSDIWRFFSRHRKLAAIKKPVHPHILRHTAATMLLFNGCSIGHIKEILGHARLETTCRYYLGVDHRAAKEAHTRYLVYHPDDR